MGEEEKMSEKLQDVERVKAWLGRMWDMDKRVMAGVERLERLRALAERVTTSYSGGGGGSSKPDRRYDYVADIVDAERELRGRAAEYVRIEREIGSVVDRIADGEVSAVMELRYLGCLSSERIAEKLYMSDRDVRRKIRKGEEMAAQIMADMGISV